MIKSKTRFWRVVWYHKNGYSAPQYHVETTIRDLDFAKKEAIKLAKSRSRLADFPKVWYFKLTEV